MISSESRVVKFSKSKLIKCEYETTNEACFFKSESTLYNIRDKTYTKKSKIIPEIQTRHPVFYLAALLKLHYK